MSDPVDRRESARIKSMNLVSVAQLELHAGSALTVGRTVDVSTGGMRIELSDALPLRSTISVSVALGNDIVEVVGRVCYVGEIDDTRCAVGVQFVDLSPESRDRIATFLTKR